MKLTKEGMAEMAANGYITTSSGQRLGPNGENLDRPIGASLKPRTEPLKETPFKAPKSQGGDTAYHSDQNMPTSVDDEAPGQMTISTADLVRRPDGSMGPSQTATFNIPEGLRRALSSLDLARTYGTARLTGERQAEEARSYTDKYANGEKYDELPLGPGYSYMSHLFKRHRMADRIEAQKRNGLGEGPKIFTDQIEAVKAALATMGIYGDKNPGGLPIDIQEAKKIFFGDSEVDEIKETEWRQTIEIGDSKIDPKRIRKFVNHDGSLTWEILNQDKTVMSRFTLGDYNGTKIFAQGGYKKFAEVLKKAREKVGPNTRGQFDAIRGMFGGE